MNKEIAIFDYIRKNIPASSSLVDVISDVLELSYDASYRRINGKTSLSFDEAYRLIEHFKIPLKNIYDVENEHIITGTRTVNKGSVTGLEEYFSKFTSIVSGFSKVKNTQVIYTAKDLPIYHSLETPFTRRFKLFAFTYLLSDDTNNFNVRFEDFKAPKSLNDSAKKISKSFKKLPIHEIWNDTTLNSNLYQINFLHDLRLITTEEALQVCDDFIENMKLIENRASEGRIENTDVPFKLYYNRMINLNNSFFITSKDQRKLIMPYTTLSFLTIDDDKMNDEVASYFNNQLEFSKNLSDGTGMERKLFFTGVYERLKKFRMQIESKDLGVFL